MNQSDEYIKRLLDPKFYLESFTKIKGKTPGLMPFILNEAQKDLFNAINKNSRVIILKARQIGFCLSPHTKVLTSSLRWVEIQDLKIGDTVVAVDEKAPGPKLSRKMQTAVVENKFEVQEEAIKFIMEDGAEIVSTPQHRWMGKKWRTSTDVIWEKSCDFKVGDVVKRIVKPWDDSSLEDAWMGGFIDGDGSFRRKKNYSIGGLSGCELAITQSPGDLMNKVKKYFGKRGYSDRFERDNRTPNGYSVFSDRPVDKVVIAKMGELFRLAGQSRAEKLFEKRWWEGAKLPTGDTWCKIKKIEKLPKQRMIDLQTSEKTYIANGFVSHNSTAAVGYLYHRTITTPGTNTALIGYNSDLTAELLDKTKTFYRTTPESIRPRIQYNSKYEISFPAIDSKILVLPSSENVGRGYTLHNVLATELAFWDKAGEKMLAIENAVPADGKIIIESCVSGDTIVTTSDGLQKMEDLFDWGEAGFGHNIGPDITLATHNGVETTNSYYKSGIQKGYRIKTKSGSFIGMSSIHPLLLIREGQLGMVKAKDMVVGDHIATKVGANLWGNYDPREDFVLKDYNKNHKQPICVKQLPLEDISYLLGVIVGDGYVDRRTICITSSEAEIRDFLFSLSKYGIIFKEGPISGNRSKAFHYRCNNVSFSSFVFHCGIVLGAKAPKKTVPSCILRMEANFVSSFLSGLFDTDGSSSVKKSGIGGVRVNLSSTSIELLTVVKLLLLNFGIIAHVDNGKIVYPTRRVTVSSFVYYLNISSASNSCFFKKIGFKIARKEKYRKFCATSVGFLIPGLRTWAKKRYTCASWGVKGIQKALGLGMGGRGKRDEGMRYPRLKRGIELLPDVIENDDLKYLKNIYLSGYYYDEIVSIVPMTEEVFDFTVNNAHTFVANGFVSSNTPNGMGNQYHQMWMAENDYIKKKYGWWWGYTKDEIEIIRRRINNPMRFAQEYGLEFLASGRPVFPSSLIKEMLKGVYDVGQKFKGPDGEMHEVTEDKEDKVIMYFQPEDGIPYIVGVDVAEGVTGGDFSVFTIFNRKTGHEVANWRGHMSPDRFGALLDKWGRKYNNALMVVEINNHGLTTVTSLKNKMYPQMYFRPMVKMDTMSTSFSDRLGWKTTKVTRPLMIDELREALADRSLVIHTRKTLDEMLTFVFNDNSDMVASSGFHDDCIFATAICFQGFKVMHSGKLDQIAYEGILPANFSY